MTTALGPRNASGRMTPGSVPQSRALHALLKPLEPSYAALPVLPPRRSRHSAPVTGEASQVGRLSLFSGVL